MISFASLFSAPEATPSYGEPEWMPSPPEVARGGLIWSAGASCKA